MRRLYITKIPWVALRGAAPSVFDPPAPTVTATDELVDLRIADKRLRPPTRLQAPPLVFDDDTLAKSQFVLEESVRYLMHRFSAAEFLTVYIPSPLVSYRLDTAAVKVGRPDGAGRLYSVSEIYRLSDALCNRVLASAQRLGSDFLDLRPYVRQQSQDQTLHGPNDWNHFNRRGYEVMGKAIAGQLQERGGRSPCEAIEP